MSGLKSFQYPGTSVVLRMMVQDEMRWLRWLGSGKKLPGQAALLDVLRGQPASAGFWAESLAYNPMMDLIGRSFKHA
jgi:hypothetical protein